MRGDHRETAPFEAPLQEVRIHLVVVDDEDALTVFRQGSRSNRA
jgi:hypothetical protein